MYDNQFQLFEKGRPYEDKVSMTLKVSSDVRHPNLYRISCTNIFKARHAVTPHAGNSTEYISSYSYYCLLGCEAVQFC